MVSAVCSPSNSCIRRLVVTTGCAHCWHVWQLLETGACTGTHQHRGPWGHIIASVSSHGGAVISRRTKGLSTSWAEKYLACGHCGMQELSL